MTQQFAAGRSMPPPWLNATAVNYKGDTSVSVLFDGGLGYKQFRGPSL